MRARLGPLFAIALSLALAGCLDTLFGATDPELGPLPDAASMLTCPPGQRIMRTSDVCVGTLEPQNAALVEPSLAVDPTNPLRMAAGFNAFPRGVALPLPSQVPTRLLTVHSDVYVTEDGGARWRRTSFQAPNGPGTISPLPGGDAHLVFDEAGVLHVSYLVGYPRSGTDERDLVVAYTSSADLGLSWTTPVVFWNEEEFNDRNWIAAGPDGSLYVTWSIIRGASTTGIAWSLDGGATWTNATGLPGNCFAPSPMAFIGGVPHFGCARSGDILLHRFDAATGTAQLVSVIPGMNSILPRVHVLANGTVAVVTYTGAAAVSRDNGSTWSAPVWPASSTAVDDEWVSSLLLWSEADPWSGQIHVLFGPHNNTEGAKPMVHLILDPLTLRIVKETVLVPDGAPRRSSLSTVQFPSGDDFMTMAFTPDRGILMWTYDGGPDYTYVVPHRAIG